MLKFLKSILDNRLLRKEFEHAKKQNQEEHDLLESKINKLDTKLDAAGEKMHTNMKEISSKLDNIENKLDNK